ncbi:hypothetical protein Tco_0248381 [Tanacetum coccineum]
MMEADRLLAERLQTREREELTNEEKGKLFMELMEKRRKHFAALRAQEKRNRPPTKAQKRSQMSTYLKHMGGYKHKQLMGKSYNEIQKLFDKEMKRVNTFVAMSSEAQESNEKEEMVVRLRKLKANTAERGLDTRPEDEHERVLLGDFKVMFEPDIRSKVWRDLQGYTHGGFSIPLSYSQVLVIIKSSNAHGFDLFRGSFRCFAPLRRRKRSHLAFGECFGLFSLKYLSLLKYRTMRAMMSLLVGRNRNQAVYILAWQLTKVAAMADVFCFSDALPF